MLPVKVDGGSCITVPPFGGKLSFVYKSKLSGNDKICQIGPGPEKNLFYAYFEDDVDFQVKMDNTLSKNRSIRYNMEVMEKKYGFLMDAGKVGQHEVLESNGKKLHFIRQLGTEGKSLITNIAASRKIKIRDASLLVSRIHFKISYSKLPLYTIKVNLPAEEMLSVEVDESTAVAQVKTRIAEKIGHPPSNFALNWNGRQQDDKLTMESLGVQEDDQLKLESVIFPIHIEMNSMTFRTLRMSSWDCIGDLKKKIEESDGIPAVQQKIMFNEKEFKDDLSVLGESNIIPSSKIQLTLAGIFPLRVKSVPSNTVVSVLVCSRNTVQDVCQKLEKTHGIRASNNKIYAIGKQVVWYQVLEDIGITDSSSNLFLVDPNTEAYVEEEEEDEEDTRGPKRPRMSKTHHFPISLKLLDKTVVSLTVGSSDAVEELKEKIKQKLGRPVENLATIVRGNEILLSEKNLPLEVYEIGENSEIQEAEVIQVFVKTLTGKTVAIMCSPRDIVEEFRLLIQEKEGTLVDQQRLVFGGKQLDDGQTLEDNNIRKGSTIQLLPRMKGGLTSGCDVRYCRCCRKPTMPAISERGAITFGEKSSQTFRKGEFEEDELIKINPFTVELRFAVPN